MKKFLFILILGTMTLAAPFTPKDQTLASLTKLENAWKAQKIKNYSFTLERSCFCAPKSGSMQFKVSNGTSKISNVSKGLNANDLMAFSSIEKLYSRMKTVLQKGGRVALVMYSQRGYPTQITLDQNIKTTDDELYLTISNFKTF